MIAKFGKWIARTGSVVMGALAALSVAAAPVQAQVSTVDPNTAIDADLAPQGGVETIPGDPAQPTYPADPAYPAASAAPAGQAPPPVAQPAAPAAPASAAYQKDDVVSAAEGVFGKGAEGLASLIEKILKDQGEPNAYIAGREASGAIILGLRYGSGTLSHKIEGQRDVYWTGPSIGFDVGGNASKVFVLVYNLYDTEELYERYPAAEGALYVVGGFTATYLRKGNVVLIPIRLGVGWRAGVNAGYMKFTKKSRIIPF